MARGAGTVTGRVYLLECCAGFIARLAGGYPAGVRPLLLCLILLMAACGDGEPPEPLPDGDMAPVDVVEQWLEAVAEIDVERLEVLVEPVGLAVLAGVENQARSVELVGLVESGVAGPLADGYWRSFRDDFEALRGIGFDAITVGEQLTTSQGPEHVAVEIVIPDQSATVSLRNSESGGWQVDMVATVGAGLAGQLREYLESALDGDYSESIADAYRFAVMPGLDAAIALDPDNALLVFETEFIRQLVS